jgi:hypothetical protein
MESKPSHAALAVVLSIVGALALAFGVLVVVNVASEHEDLARGWRNPPHYASVRRAPAAANEPRRDRSEAGDFDGDGVDDVLECVYLHRMFLFAQSTSGMVYVHSGASGALLLAHPVPTPMSDVHWRPDSDGDGADEVLVDGPPLERFAFVRAAR